MKIKSILTIMIPSVYSWLFASLLLLIYSFDIIDFVESTPNNPFSGLGAVLLSLILILIIIILYFTGVMLDKYPEYLLTFILIGMVGSSIMAIFFVICITQNIMILLLVDMAALAFFFAILLTASGTLFAGITDMWYRGRTYSIIIFIFILLSLLSILLGGLVSSRFDSPDPLSYSWVIILPLVGFFGLILSCLFYLITKDMGTPWIPDAWPTKFKKIIGRRSVRAYLISHVLLYCMLGIVIASFSRIGDIILSDPWFIQIPSLGTFDLPKDKTFWFIVLLGDIFFIIPAGLLADRFGRKNLIITAIYGIVFATIIFGLERTYNSFLIAALIVGLSFALLHPTLDSSLWADISPRDGLGRYYALGFISLAIGLGIGYAFGHWVLKPSLDILDFVTYLLTILAILAAFPLFWVSDSYKPLDFSLLLVIDEGGLPIFDYSFQKDLGLSKDLTLLSGALTAVASFMSETLSEKGDLNLVRHGTHFILTEKIGSLSAAIFSNKQDPELHKSLYDFLDKFCKRFSNEFETWNGNRSVFDSGVDIAEEVFGHLAPSINIEKKP